MDQNVSCAEPPFSIRMTRSGGFAGLRREWTVEVSGSDDLEQWRPLVEACPWDASFDQGFADGYLYAFVVADLATTVPENQLAGPWQTLRDEIQRRAEAS